MRNLAGITFNKLELYVDLCNFQEQANPCPNDKVSI